MARNGNTVTRVSTAAVAALATAVVAIPATSAQAKPTHETEVVPVKGITKPVRIAVDRYGIPHISAQTTYDVFFGQGFNAARDRLFQIDLSHRRGLGKLSEVFGPAYVDQDRAARLFLYRGDMKAEWEAYGPDAKRIATEFAAGVNAYIDWLADNPDALPPEFRALGYRPDRWKPEDVVRIRTHALVSGLSDEVARAKLACADAMDLDPLRVRLQPSHRAQVLAGMNYCLPDNVLDVYELATKSVEFTPEMVTAGAAAGADAARLTAGGGDAGEPATEGSNNWSIAPRRTATGRPILANDPHRVHQAPSLRYVAHLKAPGVNVIGGGEPALPGISIGHNERIGFGLTVFGIDAQDLYVYELNQDRTAYRYKGGWKPFDTQRTSIPVKGSTTQTRELVYTAHGPVIHVDTATNRAFALRSVWQLPGTSAYFGSIAYMRAQNWQQFLDGMKRWGTPGENQIYADVDGNIGWKAGGTVPRRSGWDGLLPVPGDGRYEWTGTLPSEDLPSVFNPKEGFFATANQYNLPPGTPASKVTSYVWSGPERHQRIVNVLSGARNHTLADSQRLQHDVTSVRAQWLLRLLAPLRSDDPVAAKALTLLKGWDGAETLGSPQATLFERYWQQALNTAVRDALVTPERRSLVASVDWLVIRDVLERPDARLGGNPRAARDALLVRSLAAAYTAAESELGADIARWGYSGNPVAMEHPLGGVNPSWNVGPFAIPGSGTTPIAAGRASYKQVLDVGAWDRSLVINTPGQSGNPSDPHYRDLARTWAAGQHVPMLFSDAAIAKNTERTILLVPARR